MARGRKKIKIRDFRFEKIRAAEAMKFLNLDATNTRDERFFYRLVEEGYIKRYDKGFYELGEIMLGYLRACSDKRYSISDFLLALSEWKIKDEKNYEEIEQVEREKEQVKKIHVQKINVL